VYFFAHSKTLVDVVESRHVSALSVAECAGAHLGAALFDDNQWHALISTNGKRLEDLPTGFILEEEARRVCYWSIDVFFVFASGRVPLPSFESLNWEIHLDAQDWVDEFYRKPLWHEDRTQARSATST
jgi:hypothetical protein